jgi:hypothetical protein
MSPYQILVSLDALKLLYGILCTLLDELREIDLLFRIETDAQRPGRVDRATREFHSFDDDELKKNIVPQCTKRILALQKSLEKSCKGFRNFPTLTLFEPSANCSAFAGVRKMINNSMSYAICALRAAVIRIIPAALSACVTTGSAPRDLR